MMKKGNLIDKKGTMTLFATVLFIAMIVAATLSQSETIKAAGISIPVALSQDGETWTDQNGKVVEQEAVEEFFEYNPNYAKELFYFNDNPYYLTAIQSATRSQALDDLRHEFCLGNERDDRDIEALNTALQKIVDNPPSDEAFSQLLAHLGDNFATMSVRSLQVQCWSSIAKSQSSKDTARFLFFGVLAKCMDEGNFERFYGTGAVLSRPVPTILAADNQTWLDQNGIVMDTEEAISFLLEHERYARDILRLNKNPLYLDTWHSETRDAAIDKLQQDVASRNSSQYSSEDSSHYTWVIHDSMADAPNRETLRNFRIKLSTNSACNEISDLMICIENDNLESLDDCVMPKYIFWCAVGKITEIGTFQTSFKAKEPAKGQ